MPRYYFELKDNDCVSDDVDGVDFDTAEEAYQEAVTTLSEMAKDLAPADGPRTLKMTIYNAERQIVGAPELSFDPSGLFRHSC